MHRSTEVVTATELLLSRAEHLAGAAGDVLLAWHDLDRETMEQAARAAGCGPHWARLVDAVYALARPADRTDAP